MKAKIKRSLHLVETKWLLFNKFVYVVLEASKSKYEWSYYTVKAFTIIPYKMTEGATLSRIEKIPKGA